MTARRQLVHPGTRPEAVLNSVEREELQAERHKFRKLLDWLLLRETELRDAEDRQGSFRDDCPNHMHVRAFKGARQECADIHQYLDELFNPKPKE